MKRGRKLKTEAEFLAFMFPGWKLIREDTREKWYHNASLNATIQQRLSSAYAHPFVLMVNGQTVGGYAFMPAAVQAAKAMKSNPSKLYRKPKRSETGRYWKYVRPGTAETFERSGPVRFRGTKMYSMKYGEYIDSSWLTGSRKGVRVKLNPVKAPRGYKIWNTDSDGFPRFGKGQQGERGTLMISHVRLAGIGYREPDRVGWQLHRWGPYGWQDVGQPEATPEAAAKNVRSSK